MAFLEGLELQRKERFSLLLLEPGEIYFEDFSVFYYQLGLPEQEAIEKRQRGRLKICSKSLVFDPNDVRYPILKFLFKDVTVMEKWVGPLLSKLDVKDRMLLIQSTHVVEMKAGNIIAPYTFKQEKKGYLFSLTYKKVDDCLPQMCQLQRASTLERGDQTAMINAIVMSRQARVKFDTSWLDSLYETIIMESQGDHITPLATNPGRIMLTSDRLYFQPFNNVDPIPVWKIKLSDIRRVIKRRFLLRHVGLEVYCHENRQCPHMYLAMKSQTDRDQLYESLLQQPELRLEDPGTENMTLRWQNGNISNYEYIMYLNSMADRSINDLTQYPVFPWVVTDYTSDHLDLRDPSIYRDLSKPVGALNQDRLDRLLERVCDMPEPKFLYGSHYSTPGFVLFYLARVAPEYMLCLQYGKFDHPDRMFNSIPETWKNCLGSFSDFKELIPEFYDSRGEFLKNNPSISFGQRQNGGVVSSVALPPWASDPEDFVDKLRAALESDHVSMHLHQWIDLIFGYKQQGEEAEKAHNVFYYLTYEGAVDLENVKDLNHRHALENQIMEFGQIPKQLFTSPHPQRFPSGTSQSIPSPLPSTTEQTHKSASNGSLGTISGERKEVVSNCITTTSSRWKNLQNLKPGHHHRLHKDSITNVIWGADGNKVYSVSQDMHLKVYSVSEQKQLRSIPLSTMPLSSCVVLPGGKTVIAGCFDNYIYVYSVEYGRMLGNYFAHNDAVSCLCHQSELLVSSSWDSTVKLWKCESSARKGVSLSLEAELDMEAGVKCLSLKPDSSMCASGTTDGQIVLWDVKSQIPIAQFHNHIGIVNDISFSTDGRRLISCGEDSYMRVIDISTGTEVFTKDMQDEIKCLKWDDNLVLAGASSGSLRVWDLANVQELDTIQAHSGAITCVDISCDGKVVTGGDDRVVLTWTS